VSPYTLGHKIWLQETRNIAASSGAKCVLSVAQEWDRQTERRTDERTEPLSATARSTEPRNKLANPVGDHNPKLTSLLSDCDGSQTE